MRLDDGISVICLTLSEREDDENTEDNQNTSENINNEEINKEPEITNNTPENN